MARPSQAITFPEVLMSKIADRPRGFVPSAAPGRPNVDMGSDEHGWYADAVKVANDRVNQIRSSKKMYERGVRPFEALGIRRNRGAIVPFGVNSIGGQFVSQPSAQGGHLTGGIMFTKEGQEYLQDLLNKRQKQYAEMYGETQAREIPSSYTDPTEGDKILAVVYPLYNTLLDDLRTFTLKTDSFSKFWAVMLSSLPLLGANYRTKIIDIADTLDLVLDGAYSGAEERQYRKELTKKEKDLLESLNVRINRAVAVLRAYCGNSVNGSNSPIDAPSAEQREAIVSEMNKKLGEAVKPAYLREARVKIGSTISGPPSVDTFPEEHQDEGEARIRALARGEVGPYDAEGQYRGQPYVNALGRVEGGPLGRRPRSNYSSASAANDGLGMPWDAEDYVPPGAVAYPETGSEVSFGPFQTAPARSVRSQQVRRPVAAALAAVAEGEGSPHNYHRKITPQVAHHRLLNRRNERK